MVACGLKVTVREGFGGMGAMGVGGGRRGDRSVELEAMLGKASSNITVGGQSESSMFNCARLIW